MNHETPRTEANRRNAQLSTGPVTPEGKAKSSLNAVKTGLTGRTVVLPTDDAAAYAAHLERYFTGWAPATDDEKDMVQDLADTQWRLERIPSLEAGIYALGHREFAAEFADEEEATRKALIQAKVFLTYQRQLNNLSIQENRLRRTCEKLTSTLSEAQKLRKDQARIDFNRAVSEYIMAKKENRPFDHSKFGFDFSLDEIRKEAEQRPVVSLFPELAHMLKEFDSEIGE